MKAVNNVIVNKYTLEGYKIDKAMVIVYLE